MFREYFDRHKAAKRARILLKTCDHGTELRADAIIKHRTFWPKTPCGQSDDDHEAGFVHGYASREKEVQTLKEALQVFVKKLDRERTLNMDVRRLRMENDGLKQKIADLEVRQKYDRNIESTTNH